MLQYKYCHCDRKKGWGHSLMVEHLRHVLYVGQYRWCGGQTLVG